MNQDENALCSRKQLQRTLTSCAQEEEDTWLSSLLVEIGDNVQGHVMEKKFNEQLSLPVSAFSSNGLVGYVDFILGSPE